MYFVDFRAHEHYGSSAREARPLQQINRVIVRCVAALVVAFVVSCSGGGATTSDYQSSSQASQRTQAPEWYEGGTLHKGSVLQWQLADPKNKLATCADFVANMRTRENFVPKIQDSINSVDEMKPYAQELVKYLNAATARHPDPEQNRIMYANQTVASMATIGMVTLDWLK